MRDDPSKPDRAVGPPTIELRSKVETACPLDCPDSCSLTVTVSDGRVVALDGSRRNPVTGGYICAKVRRFADRMYGPHRLEHPAVRVGPKGNAAFSRITWDEAIDLAATRMREARDTWGGESILPFSYGGSNGLLTQDTTDARLFRRLGASRLARNVCAAPSGAAAQALYGKMPSVTYQDYVHSRLIVVWGANPSVSGIHLVPFIQEARKQGAKLVVVDPRVTTLARQADLHIPLTPGSDLPVALALHRHLFESGAADSAFLERCATGVTELRERAAEWTFERAASAAGVQASMIRDLAEMYAAAAPALIRCGWGLERNRNGGSAVAAVLALPAVAGKFGVRGGGYALSNSAAWSIDRTWIGEDEPDTRVVNMNHLGRMLTGDVKPPVKVLFVYNCNPVATVPHQNLILQGLAREDLFTIVFDQVLTDTAAYADLVLPATTFLEAYDLARAYGPISLQMVQPAVDAVGESRPNPEVFGQLLAATGLDGGEELQGELETLLQVLDQLPGSIGDDLRNARAPSPPFGLAPVQFVDAFPRTPDGKVNLFPESLARESKAGLYRYLPDPGTDRHPLALISPSSDRTISSTLGELPRPEAALVMHPLDSRARGLEEGADVRVFNEIGEVRCKLSIEPSVRPGTVVLPKGLWRSSTVNKSTATALAPDSLSDIGAGACFNDARVQVERVAN
jgi:anaerobic selenocysteine-containing dehydrogenase